MATNSKGKSEIKIVKPQFHLKGELNEEINEVEDSIPWPSVQFGIPNRLLRSAVFGVQREKRDGVLDQFNFTYREHYEITYIGPRLNQDDSIVWQAILRAIKNTKSPLGKAITIKKSDVLNHLKKSNGGDNYKWLMSCLDKLAISNLKCVKGKDVFSSSLIIGYSLNDSDSYFSAGVSSFLAPLLSEDLTDIDILRKSKLSSQLSKWLHDFYSSHTNPIPYPVDKLHAICRSNQNMSKFKMSLKKSIDDLKFCEPPLLSSDSFLDSKNNIVYAFKETGSPYVPAKKDEPEKKENKKESLYTAHNFL